MVVMVEIVVALLMIVNGEIKEHRIQESMSHCLKAKRIAMRSGTSRIDYRGEKFSGYNKPKNDRTKTKKFSVLAKSGDQVKLIRYGDANMTIGKSDPARRKSFRARHKCDTKKSILSAGYWSCKKW